MKLAKSICSIVMFIGMSFTISVIASTPGQTEQSFSSKLQLDLTDINARLDEGFGDVSMKKAFVAIDPVNVDLENLDYDLSMKDNFFIIEGNGQKMKLDLKSFKKIFEQQKFSASNTNINIRQGEYINIDSEYFDVALAAVKLSFFGAKISCAPDVGRDITQEILSLCLKKSSIELPKGVLSGREDVIYQTTPEDIIYRWAQNFYDAEKIDHLPKFTRPVLTHGFASINKGKIILRADLKILLTMKLSGTGFIEYHSKEDVIALRIDTLDSQVASLKKPLLKILDLLQNEFFSVDGDTLVFNLKEMRVNSKQ